MCVRERERERERQRERERERERDRDRQTDRDRERQTDRQTDRQRQRELAILTGCHESIYQYYICKLTEKRPQFPLNTVPRYCMKKATTGS